MHPGTIVLLCIVSEAPVAQSNNLVLVQLGLDLVLETCLFLLGVGRLGRGVFWLGLLGRSRSCGWGLNSLLFH